MKKIIILVTYLLSANLLAQIPGTGPYVEEHDFDEQESKEIVKLILAADPNASRSKTDLWSMIEINCFRNTPQCFYQLSNFATYPPAPPSRVKMPEATRSFYSAALRLFGKDKHWNKVRAFGFQQFKCKSISKRYRCRADVSMPDLKGAKRILSVQTAFISHGYDTAMIRLMKKAGILCSISYTNIKANIKNGDKTYVCPVPVQKIGYIDNWIHPICTTKEDYEKAIQLVKKSYFSGQFSMPLDSRKKPVATVKFNSCVSYLDVSGIVPTGGL